MRQSSVPRLSASAACDCIHDLNFDGIESAKDAEKFAEKELHFKFDAAKPVSGSKKHMVVDYVWRKIKESKTMMRMVRLPKCSTSSQATAQIVKSEHLATYRKRCCSMLSLHSRHSVTSNT